MIFYTNVVLSLNTQDNCGDEMLAHMHSPQNALMHSVNMELDREALERLATQMGLRLCW